MSIVDRIGKLGQALLTLGKSSHSAKHAKEISTSGPSSSFEHLLTKLEADWKINDTSGSVIARVKRIRTAILPNMCRPGDARGTHRRWRDLADAYYAQQLSHYPRDYILREKNLPERIVETVERFEEDFTDKMRINEPFHTVIQVGEAIPVGTQRTRDEAGDPIMADVRRQLQTMMNELAAERTPV